MQIAWQLLWTDKREKGTESHSFHLKEMWNKTGRRQRTWGNIARHRDHREREGEGDLCPDDKAARRRGAETPTSLCREAQQQAKRTWARGDKGNHQSSHCGWEPPETEGRRARDTPKWLQGSTLKAKPTLAASYLPLLTEVRETQKVEEAEQEGPRGPGEAGAHFSNGEPPWGSSG